MVIVLGRAAAPPDRAAACKTLLSAGTSGVQDTPEIAKQLLDCGGDALARYEYQSAIGAFERAIRTSTLSHDNRMLATAQDGAGRAYLGLGHFGGAEKFFTSSPKGYEALDRK